MNRSWGAATVALVLALGACSGRSEPPADPTPSASATVDAVAAEKAEILAAFDRYWDDHVTIANSGEVPDDAFEDSTVGPYRERNIALLKKQAEEGQTRSGAPKFKDQKVTVTGDTALVLSCINDVDWPFRLADGTMPVMPDGWRQLGREFTKVDGVWLVTGGSPESTRDTCP